MVGQPVLAVLFLFPVKDVSEAHRREEAERVKREGQVVSPQVFYMTQEIGNACGTVRLLMWIVVIGSSHWAFFVVSTDQYVG
jgi:ubiquitin carboxyl-terminal hydrolase L3